MSTVKSIRRMYTEGNCPGVMTIYGQPDIQLLLNRIDQLNIVVEAARKANIAIGSCEGDWRRGATEAFGHLNPALCNLPEEDSNG